MTVTSYSAALYYPNALSHLTAECVGDESMVTRKNPFGKWPDEVMGEPIGLDDCFRAMTLGGAYSMNKENEIGSIEPGKAADMIVLNQNLFTIDPMSLIDSKVVYTIFAGEIVYDAKSSPQ